MIFFLVVTLRWNQTPSEESVSILDRAAMVVGLWCSLSIGARRQWDTHTQRRRSAKHPEKHGWQTRTFERRVLFQLQKAFFQNLHI